MKIEDFSNLSKDELIDIADFFKVFGDPTRLEILFLLQEKSLSVSKICEALDLQQSTVSQQLKLLRVQRLVRFKKDGRSAIYSINDSHIVEILKMGLEHYRELFG